MEHCRSPDGVTSISVRPYYTMLSRVYLALAMGFLVTSLVSSQLNRMRRDWSQPRRTGSRLIVFSHLEWIVCNRSKHSTRFWRQHRSK